MTTQPAHGYTRHGHPVHAKTIDHLPANGRWGRVNKTVAIWITAGVGTMQCAYLFAILAFAGLPASLTPGGIGLLFWVSSDFLQLTLLAVILVGQNIQTTASDVRATKQFEDTEVIVDRLDCETRGGLRVVLDRLDTLEAALKQGGGL